MTNERESDRPIDPAFEERTARAALEAGDLQHAVKHAAMLLAHAPQSRAYQQLLEKILGEAEDPLELFDLEAGVSFSVVAAAAYAHALAGDLGQALLLLLQATSSRPDVAYGSWLAAWFPDDAALKQVPPTAVASGLLAWSKRALARDTLDPVERAAFEPFRPLVEKFCRIYQQDPQLQLLASTLFRKVGKKKTALLLAERAQKLAPCSATHVGLGLAQRALGDRAAAIRSLRAALKEDPGSGVLAADIGDLYLELGETGPAKTWYERALKLDVPLYAEAGLCAVRHREAVEGHWLNRLHELAASRERVLAQRVRNLLTTLGQTSPSSPYEDFIPEPSEATFNVLRDLIRRTGSGTPDTVVRVACTALESPSVWLAFDLFYRSRGAPSRENPMAPPETQKPGLGLPLKEVKFLLWKYEEDLPRVAVDPPRPEVASAVRELARRPFLLTAWAEAARRNARELGEAAVADLLGCMVHVEPLTPEWTDPGRWVRAQQHAAALVLAHLGDGPWEGSVRRQVLHDLVFGPLDWTVEAAIVAATWVARQDAAAADEVASWLEVLADTKPSSAPCPYERAIRICGLRVPGLSPERRRRFERLEGGASAVHEPMGA